MYSRESNESVLIGSLSMYVGVLQNKVDLRRSKIISGHESKIEENRKLLKAWSWRLK